MFQVFVDSPSITSLVPGSDGDGAPCHSSHSAGYEQGWKGARVGFGAPPRSTSTCRFLKPPFDFSTLGVAVGLSSPGKPQLPCGWAAFPGQKQTEQWDQLGLQPLSTVPPSQGHHSSLALTAIYRQILHVWLEPLAPKHLCRAAGGQL